MKKFLIFLLFSAAVMLSFTLLLLKTDVSLGDISEKLCDWDNTPAVEVVDTGSPFKHYYNELETREKHAYNMILEEVYNMPYEIKIPKIDAIQLDRVFAALLYDNPDLFFIARRCTLVSANFSTLCRIEYSMGYVEYLECRQKLENVCNEIAASYSDPLNDWQTELEIHDYIVDNCDYELVEDDFIYSSSYGTLVNGVAACEGYSKAAKLLLDNAGIENYVVSGKAEDENGNRESHMWNIVRINGELYHLDCTWDDPVSNGESGPAVYSFFNLSDEAISATHSEFSDETMCYSMKENYFVKTGAYFESYGREKEAELSRLIADRLSCGSKYIMIKFSDEEVYKKALYDIIENGRIYNILKSAGKKTNIEFSMKSLAYYTDSKQYVLTLEPELI